MKYIAITFDDGRSDNYLLAKQVMDKYGLLGTVYITTGFIDGTWDEKNVLKSPTRPLSVDEIIELQQSGWEIGLHGDKHKTQVDDMRCALNKLSSWGTNNLSWGISVPNSVTDEAEVTRLFESDYGYKIAYVRRGRKCDTTMFMNKVFYGLYSVCGMRWAYRCFNKYNITDYMQMDKSNIPSVVIKSNDKPKMIIDFIKRIPDNSVVVFMLHSILPITYSCCRKDPWSWEESRFDEFCARLRELVDLGIIESAPLVNFMEK